MLQLSDEDAALALNRGYVGEYRPDFLIEHPSGSIELSELGYLFFKMSCDIWGVELQTRFDDYDAYMEFNHQICSANLRASVDKLKIALHEGKIDPRNRAWVSAVVYGDATEYKKATQLTRLCRESGENVIPLPGPKGNGR